MNRTVAALVVALLALFARVALVARQGPPPPLAGDAVEYRAYADSLFERGVFAGADGSRALRMPGYPAFLAATRAAFGPSPRAVQWTQCALGALGCACVFLWAASFLRFGWALAAGFAAAAYFDLAAPCAAPLSEALYSFLLAAAFAALSAEKIPPLRRGALGGLLFAAAYLTRPEILPFAGLVLLGAPLLFKGLDRRSAAAGLVALTVAAGAWTARNAAALGRFVPVTTAGQYNLYLGLRLPLEPQNLGLGPLHSAPAGADELARDADFGRAYAELKARVPLGRRLRAYAFNLLSMLYPFLPDYDWTYAALVPFWLFGLIFAARRPALWGPAGIVVGLFAVFAILAGPVSRYRFGFAPCLLVLAAAGAQELSDRVGNARVFAAGAGAWLAANLGIWAFAPEFRAAALGVKALLTR